MSTEHRHRRDPQEFTAGQVLAGALGGIVIVAAVALSLWAFWLTMRPMFEAWRSLTWVPP
jgi:hypothetical protein